VLKNNGRRGRAVFQYVGWMLTVGRLAISLRESLATSEPDGVRLRLVRQFVMDANRDITPALIVGAPESTGSPQWDALLAGLAEYVAYNAGTLVPEWTTTPDKFLKTWWFLMPFASLHGIALAETPAALANRGVFISRASLVNV
jgi:hypothetical protein